jgi:hypothetical protein
MAIDSVRPIVRGFFLVGSVNWVVEVALTTAVYERTGSTSWVAASVALRLVPAIAIGPLAGVLADRTDRRLVVVGSCAARAVTLSVLAAASFSGATPAVLVALAVVDSTLATPFRPAALGLVPRAVGPAGLAAANASIGTVLQATWIVGPGAGTLAAGVVGPGFAFTVAGIAVALAALTTRNAGSCPALRRSDVPRSSLEMLRDGVVAVRQAEGAVALLMLAVIVELVFGFELVAHVDVAAQRLGIGAAGAGWLTAFIGIGGVLGGSLAAAIARGRHAGLAAAAASAGFGVCLATLALLTAAPMAFGLMAIEGGANVLYDVLTVTMLQRVLSGAVVARAQALIDAAGALALAAGSLLAPVLIGGLGLPGSLVAVGMAAIVAVVAVAPALVVADRGTSARVQSLVPVVECFRATGLFEMAPYHVVERVAAASRVTRAETGSVVVAQGDHASAVHVVEAGNLQVIAAADGHNRIVNELGPGDWFGEIGVAGGRPRTATVLAETDARVWSIPASTFLDAVASAATVSDPLMRGMQVRLARTEQDSILP